MIERGRTAHVAWVRNGSPVDTVFLHGFSDLADVWLPWFDLLPSRRSLAIDARGHGQSGLPDEPFGTSAHAADVALVLAAQEIPADGVVLIGHSMGAMTAAAVAALTPELVRAAVLEDPPFPVPPFKRRTSRDDLLAQRALTLEERIARERAAHPHWAEDEFEPQQRGTGELDVGQLDLPPEPPVAVAERLASITCPVLLVHGDVARGSMTSPEGAAACKEAAAGALTVAHLADAGHNVRRDQREAYLSAVRDFLRPM